jgi:hypothetical protein
MRTLQEHDANMPRRSDVSPRTDQLAAPLKRGDAYRTPGGGEGLYVGTSPDGLEWVAYDPADFEAMCAAFDARWRAEPSPEKGGAEPH